MTIGSAGVFISLECGATHTGRESLLRLAKAAAAAGADALKVQVIRAEDYLRPDDPTMVEFGTASGTRRERVFDALKRRELHPDEWREVRLRCRDLGVAFIATPSHRDMIDLLTDMGADAIKIAKGDMTHLELVAYAASTGLPLLLDGRERVTDLAEALRVAEEAGAHDLVIVHTPSGYPAPQAGVHLRAIPVLRELFGTRATIGYSDHSGGEHICHAAVALGVRYIEKTVSEDPQLLQVEHSISLRPDELPGLVARLRAVEAALGDPAILASSRVEPAHRRGLVAAHELPAFRVLAREDLDLLRPEAWIPANRLAEVVGRKLNRPVRAGDPIGWGDLA